MGQKVYENRSVYDAAMERVQFLFDNFDNILISFSGGKDSGVCLNLLYEYAKRTNQVDKLAIWFKDEEVIHTKTLEYIERVFGGYEDIKRKYWLCLPLRERYPNSSLCYEWKAWDKSEKEKWVRELPTSPFLITEDNCPFKFKVGDDIHDIGDSLCEWFSDKYGSTCSIMGLRAGEGIKRTMIVLGNHRPNCYKGHRYTTVHEKFVSAIPLYDWTDEDIWIANGTFGWDYNKLYDLYYFMGLTIKEMRVSTPFHEAGQKLLGFWKKTDPTLWNKIINRVDGINFASIYTGTEGLNTNIQLPAGHTWTSYKDFLLNTLPDTTRNKILSKLKNEAFTDNEQINRSICECIFRGDWSLRYFKGTKVQEKNEKKRQNLKNKYLRIAKGEDL